MTDPQRLKEAGSEIDAQLREMLRQAPRSVSMSASVRARSAAGVTKLAALGVSASGALAWIKVMLASVGIGCLGAVVVALALPRPHPVAPTHAGGALATPRNARVAIGPREQGVPAVPPVATPPVIAAEPVPQEHVARRILAPSITARAPEPSPPISGSEPALGSGTLGAAPVPPMDPLVAEQEMLEQARAALERDPMRALGSLDRLGRAFPDGQLVAEREFLRFDALRRLGRTLEAAAQGQAFLTRFARSPYADRVRRELAAGP